MQRCQLRLPHNAKPGCRRVLARQDELGDRERSAFFNSLEGSLHKRDNRAVASGIDRAGQRHVKAKLFEHERVAPAVEVFDLASAQRPRQRRLCRSCGVSGPRNRSNTVTQSAAELVYGGALAARGTMAMNRSDRTGWRGSRPDTDARGRGGKSIEFRHQIRFGERRQTDERAPSVWREIRIGAARA